MRKIIIMLSILLIAFSFTISCNGTSPNTTTNKNYTEFVLTNKDGVASTIKWESASFIYLTGYDSYAHRSYYKWYSSVYASLSSINNHISFSLPSDSFGKMSEGTYNNGLDCDIAYTDEWGNMYMTAVGTGVYSKIIITKWTETEVTGTFSAKLCYMTSNYPYQYYYVTLSGSLKTTYTKH